MEKATLGAGCFWGIEALFRRTDGVVATRVGYCGGHKTDPSYQQVCTGQTGHAEVVEVTFDPTRIAYAQILDLYFKNHDPTTLNRQGPDKGTQYRSVIFWHTPAQRAAARAALMRHAPRFKQPIVTDVVPSAPFYEAEEYHQRYLEKRGLAFCHL